MRDEASYIEGRNSVKEALRSNTPIERIFVLEGNFDGPIQTIVRDAKKSGIPIDFVSKVRLDQLSVNKAHQGVLAYISAVDYATVEDLLLVAKEKNEDPFFILLDEIEDPHNLGAMIRTANLCGAHGVIIPKHRASGITATVVKASAGAVYYTKVARVSNIKKTIESLKEQGLWFVCADMGASRYDTLDYKGPIGLVIGSEGKGISPSVKKSCDFVASIPMKGQIDSLNASVACGVLAFEISRQRDIG